MTDALSIVNVDLTFVNSSFLKIVSSVLLVEQIFMDIIFMS